MSGPFSSSLASPSLTLPVDPIVHISNPRYTIKKLSSNKKKGELTMEGPNDMSGHILVFASSLFPNSAIDHVACIIYPRYTIKMLGSKKN